MKTHIKAIATATAIVFLLCCTVWGLYNSPTILFGSVVSLLTIVKL